MAIYDINGNTLTAESTDKDELLTDIKGLDFYNLQRIRTLEELHTEFQLPTLRLYGDTSKMTKDKAVNLTAVYSDGVKSFSCIAKTKWQGEASIEKPKKNYNITLQDGKKNKFYVSFKDWPASNKYHIKANYTEPSLVRNCVGSVLGRKAYPYLYPNNARGVIDSFPFILYINDEFWGCYTWNITQNADMFAMNESNQNHMCFRCNAGAELGPWVGGEMMTIFEDRLRDDSTDYSISCLRRLYDWTNSCTVEEFQENAEKYFDLESLLYYWVVVEIECGTDSMTNNTTWASWDGEHWYILWYDTDLIFGSSSRMIATPTLDLIENSKQSSTYFYKYNPVWDHLYHGFYDSLCEKYAEVRHTIFTDAQTIIKYFTDYRDKWGTENLAAERSKWPPEKPNEDITNCESFITARLAYCDEKYGYF